MSNERLHFSDGVIQLAIIGGSGLDSLPELEIIAMRENLSTPYGTPSAPLIQGRLYGHELFFLARHGVGHSIPPHRINYRANLWALHSLGINRVLAINSVGGIHSDLGPGRIAIPEQIIDYTWGRAPSYFEGDAAPNGADSKVTHIDFTEPYCMTLRARLLAAAALAGVDIHFGGTYAAMQGPRLETKAEIDRLERDGCDMVGMTGMPEAALARELGLCYACCAVVANRAAGRGGELDFSAMERVLQQSLGQVRALLKALLLGL